MKKYLIAILLFFTAFNTSATTFWGCEVKPSLMFKANYFLASEKGAFYSKGKDHQTEKAGILEVKEHNGTASYVFGAYISSDEYVQWRIFNASISTPEHWRILQVTFDITSDGSPAIQTASFSDAKCRQIYVSENEVRE